MKQLNLKNNLKKSSNIDVEEIWKMLESSDNNSIILGLDILNKYFPNWTRSKANRIRMERVFIKLGNDSFDILLTNKTFDKVTDKWNEWNKRQLYDENLDIC